MSEHAHKIYQQQLEKREKLMSEVHNKCTGNWKKERVKVMFLSMLLKAPGSFYEHAQT